MPLSDAVKNPRLDELAKSARRAGYSPETVDALHPRRKDIASGYISIERVKAKSELLRELSVHLRAVRGEERRDSASSASKGLENA